MTSTVLANVSPGPSRGIEEAGTRLPTSAGVTPDRGAVVR